MREPRRDRPTVAFYISGHGFGHASRQVEVMNALAKMRPDADILIRSSVNQTLLTRTLQVPYRLWLEPCDSGVVQINSLEHDEDATLHAAAEFYRNIDERAAGDAIRLNAEHVRLVVGDIPPLAFEAAARAGSSSIAVANFTWDWIYEPWLTDHPQFHWLLPTIRSAYARATTALQLPFSDGLPSFPRTHPLPLIARHSSKDRRATRTQLGLDQMRPTALLSFGGFGLPSLDLDAIDCLDDWAIVTLDTVRGPVPRGVTVPDERTFFASGTRYEDLVAAVDVVITKPGYGILAECLAAKTAVLYTSRGNFREYDVLVREMPRYLRCRFIEQRSLLSGEWRSALEALVSESPAPETMATNGAEFVAGVIAELLST